MSDTDLQANDLDKLRELSERMDAQDRATVVDLPKARANWQRKWWLRYVIGPFLTGQLFDLWQWLMGKVDEFLWGWAEKSGSLPQSHPTPAQDPRARMRHALEHKAPKGKPRK